MDKVQWHTAVQYLGIIASQVNRACCVATFSTADAGTLPISVHQILDLEESVLDLAAVMGWDAEMRAELDDCRKRFLQDNERMIAHIEKLQLQSEAFAELSSALKLENETIMKELQLS